ncbi:beta-1,4-endoglucanase [Aphelenchoides avenae]|nr:beta-1,4-endoglucanase [Aphelenchus avenae]
MGVDAAYGGYLGDKATELTKLRTVDEAAIEAGIYVIIDWHIEQDAYKYVDDAVAFFRQMATDYGQYPHVIYKLWNEPPQYDWSTVVKPYHEKVLKAIRAIDPDNLASLGTPDWSGSPDKAYADPIKGEDLAKVP